MWWLTSLNNKGLKGKEKAVEQQKVVPIINSKFVKSVDIRSIPCLSLCDIEKYLDEEVGDEELIRLVLSKLDSSGNITNKTSVQIVFDSKTRSYVTTRCGTYDLVNTV